MPPMPPPIKAIRKGRERWSMSATSGHVADGLDLEAAIHRGAPRLHARARGQCLGAGKVASIDAVELFLLALVLEPDDDLEQAVHVGARRLDQLLEVVHHDPHLALEWHVGKQRDR